MKTQTREKNYVKWHPYPETPLPETEFAECYLVTAVAEYSKPYVRTAYAWKDFSAYKSEFRVLAWAELPEPYKEKT